MVSLEFIIPRYWSKTLSALYPVLHESWNFPVWLVGAGIIPGLMNNRQYCFWFFSVDLSLALCSCLACIHQLVLSWVLEISGVRWGGSLLTSLSCDLEKSQGSNMGNRRAYRICFPSLRVHYPLLQTIVWYVLSFFFFNKWKGKSSSCCSVLVKSRSPYMNFWLLYFILRWMIALFIIKGLCMQWPFSDSSH